MKEEYAKVKEFAKIKHEKGFRTKTLTLTMEYEQLEMSRKEKVANRDSIYNDEKVFNRVMKEISDNKANNIKILRQYGVTI